MSYERTKQLWSAIRDSQYSVNQIDIEVTRLEEKFDQAQIEIEKLNSIIDELRDENDMLRAEIKMQEGGEA